MCQGCSTPLLQFALQPSAARAAHAAQQHARDTPHRTL
jgi:hypothetical protein